MKKNIFIGGLSEGRNFPKGKRIFDLEGCKDIIIVDREYFLKKIGLIKSWAETAV